MSRPDGPICPNDIRLNAPDGPSWGQCNCPDKKLTGQATRDTRSQFGSPDLPEPERFRRMRRALKLFRDAISPLARRCSRLSAPLP